MNIMIYLKGRREYLKTKAKIEPSDSSNSRNAMAALNEVCTLIHLLEGEEELKGNNND